MTEPKEESTTEPREPWSQTSSGGERYLSPLEAARKLALAGIGAVTVAGELTDEIFTELVKRGEQTREQAVEEFNQMRARNSERRAETTSLVRSRVDSLMNRLNLPSKGDLDSINAKLNILTRKVDEVQASQVGVPSSGASDPPFSTGTDTGGSEASV